MKSGIFTVTGTRRPAENPKPIAETTLAGSMFFSPSLPRNRREQNRAQKPCPLVRARISDVRSLELASILARW